MEQQLPVCVIGAGVSGLATVKHLQDRNVSFDCFEIGSDIGGNWRYDNDSGRSAVFASLQVDTSKDRFAFADLPMPKTWPLYLHHVQVLEYLEKYAEVFDLKDRITFRSEVLDAEPHGQGWRVTVRDLKTGESESRSYRAVIVTSGHHWDPVLPDFDGVFSGETMHAQTYRTPERFIGKNVVIVGAGNSGADIASELSWHAEAVTLSTRSGAHVFPNLIFGRSLDSFYTRISSQLPLGAQRSAYRALLFMARGSQASYGFPTPKGPILSQHPTVSDDLLGLVKEGHITVRAGISRLMEDEVVFVDGSRARADVIIFATGYRITFPFLPSGLVATRENKVQLYKQVVAVDVKGLYFVGLIQPVGALPPLAEQQARWVSQLLDGAVLPSKGEMRSDMVAASLARSQRYDDSSRHTIQVDYWPYLDAMRVLCDDNDEALSSP